MNNAHALHWEMYGQDTAVAFTAMKDHDGYGLFVTRGDQILVSDMAADSGTLMRKSSELRTTLERLGFAAKPAAPRTSQLAGGVCWGPAAPLHSSMLDALR